jgi:Domain of unknown function (DUF2703)
MSSLVSMDTILEVTWRHTPDQPSPCVTCSDTGRNFQELLEELLPAFREEGISVRFSDEKVEPGGPPENLLLLNGIAIGPLLSHAAQGEEYCQASKCMPPAHLHRLYTGQGGISCDEAPEILVRKAIVLSLDRDIRSQFGSLR